MPNIIKIESIEDSRVSPFASLTEKQLLKLNEQGYFIAESPKVINVALEYGFFPEAILCEEKHIYGDAAEIIEKCDENMPIYTGDRDILSKLTGYKLTRGVLALIKRLPPSSYQNICKMAKKIAVLESVCDTTNIGAIFRSAAALGIDAILLTPDTCDPLNRRAIRVSMGNVFRIPWAYLPDNNITSTLNSYGYSTVALALTKDALPINKSSIKEIDRIALILGTEGDGLKSETISEANETIIIPMANGVDSLNVAAASAIAFWELQKR